MDFGDNSVVHITMVSCLHQGNIDIKRKLRVWGAQKCNLFLGAKTVRTSTGLQTTNSIQFNSNSFNALIYKKFG